MHFVVTQRIDRHLLSKQEWLWCILVDSNRLGCVKILAQSRGRSLLLKHNSSKSLMDGISCDVTCAVTEGEVPIAAHHKCSSICSCIVKLTWLRTDCMWPTAQCVSVLALLPPECFQFDSLLSQMQQVRTSTNDSRFIHRFGTCCRSATTPPASSLAACPCT